MGIGYRQFLRSSRDAELDDARGERSDEIEIPRIGASTNFTARVLGYG